MMCIKLILREHFFRGGKGCKIQGLTHNIGVVATSMETADVIGIIQFDTDNIV